VIKIEKLLKKLRIEAKKAGNSIFDEELQSAYPPSFEINA
jgi:hypothetical protein